MTAWAEHDAEVSAAEYAGPGTLAHELAAERAARAASVAALRQLADGYAQLADAIEDNAAIPHPSLSNIGHDLPVMIYMHDAQTMAAAASALPCSVAKTADDNWLNLTGQIGGVSIKLFAARENVCTITGYEDRQVEEVVTPAVTETVTRSMPVWDCAPVLAPRPAAKDSGR